MLPKIFKIGNTGEKGKGKLNWEGRKWNCPEWWRFPILRTTQHNLSSWCSSFLVWPSAYRILSPFWWRYEYFIRFSGCGAIQERNWKSFTKKKWTVWIIIPLRQGFFLDLKFIDVCQWSVNIFHKQCLV